MAHPSVVLIDLFIGSIVFVWVSDPGTIRTAAPQPTPPTIAKGKAIMTTPHWSATRLPGLRPVGRRQGTRGQETQRRGGTPRRAR